MIVYNKTNVRKLEKACYRLFSGFSNTLNIFYVRKLRRKRLVDVFVVDFPKTKEHSQQPKVPPDKLEGLFLLGRA